MSKVEFFSFSIILNVNTFCLTELLQNVFSEAKLIFDLHQCNADDDPDDFTDTADDADEDAKGGRETEGSDGKDETTLLDTQLHRQEANEVGEERGERYDEDGVEVGEGDACEATSAVDAEEQEHEQHLARLDDTRQIFEQQ